ncbi:hypothetical protein B0H10DRAFT_1941078 [Mycena sp. CBHHK59/15]|nr:hypothetical protein B0H10DRAFT_1941078 [Mycena sp. CBHHK59/15]
MVPVLNLPWSSASCWQSKGSSTIFLRHPTPKTSPNHCLSYQISPTCILCPFKLLIFTFFRGWGYLGPAPDTEFMVESTLTAHHCAIQMQYLVIEATAAFDHEFKYLVHHIKTVVNAVGLEDFHGQFTNSGSGCDLVEFLNNQVASYNNQVSIENNLHKTGDPASCPGTPLCDTGGNTHGQGFMASDRPRTDTCNGRGRTLSLLCEWITG